MFPDFVFMVGVAGFEALKTLRETQYNQRILGVKLTFADGKNTEVLLENSPQNREIIVKR